MSRLQKEGVAVIDGKKQVTQHRLKTLRTANELRKRFLALKKELEEQAAGDTQKLFGQITTSASENGQFENSD